jgi:hypothetical protein
MAVASAALLVAAGVAYASSSSDTSLGGPREAVGPYHGSIDAPWRNGPSAAV